MANVALRYTKDNPKWVQAENVFVDVDLAIVEAWGYEFEPKKIQSKPSDRFELALDYVLVRHPSGNWLYVFWWV
jgi:hypothetical protein